MKQIFTLLLALAATSVLWAYDFQYKEIYYTYTSKTPPYTLEINSANRAIESMAIPQQLLVNGTNYYVKSIGEAAFSHCHHLQSITIPTSVERIGTWAFYGCEHLKEIKYLGTKDQWEEVALDELWNERTPAIVVCTDGNIDPSASEDETSSYSLADTDFLFEEEIVLAPIPLENPVEEEEEEVIFMVVETMPEFPGGQQALFKYIEEEKKYPIIAKENGIQGRVICQFVVNKDGSIVDVIAIRSSGEPSLDKEAIRVIKSMPKWKPGKQRGKPVRVKYTVPVNFRLQ